VIEAAAMVTPGERLSVSKHDSDNRFYECADAAGVDYIVPGTANIFSMSYKDPGLSPAGSC